jgi:hypothetical protein
MRSVLACHKCVYVLRVSVYSQCAVCIVVGPRTKGHFIHVGPTFGPRVLLLLES